MLDIPPPARKKTAAAPELVGGLPPGYRLPAPKKRRAAGAGSPDGIPRARAPEFSNEGDSDSVPHGNKMDL